jgi:hypothetical protein
VDSYVVPSNKANDILLLERIFIKELDPPFNKDEGDQAQIAYIEAFLERQYQYWEDKSEKDARRHFVPIDVYNLAYEIEMHFDSDLIDEVRGYAPVQLVILV